MSRRLFFIIKKIDKLINRYAGNVYLVAKEADGSEVRILDTSAEAKAMTAIKKSKKSQEKNETKTKIKDHYNQKHQFRVQTDKEFEAPIQKAKVKREKQQAKDFKSWLRKEKREIRFYLASQKFRNTPTYAKVKRGHKTYPDATKYELTHGVNSQASKKFRVEHGLNEEYSGKVVK